MAVIPGPVVKNTSVAYPDSAGDVVANRYEMTIPAASSTADIYEIGSIPPNCRVINMFADVQASLGAAGCVFNVGVMSGVPGAAVNPDNSARTCGSEFFSGLAASAAAPGAVTPMSAVTGFRVTPVAYERSIGIQFTTRGSGTAGLVALVTTLATT